MKRLLFVLCVGATCVLSACNCGGRPCGVDNCSGCCDSKGNCQAGTAGSACGSGGHLCIACPSAQSCLAGTCVTPPGNGGDAGNGGPDGGGMATDGGNDNGGDGGSFDGAYARFCDQLVAEICANLTQCKFWDPARIADCTSFYAETTCNVPLVEASLAKGYLTFDTNAAATCLALTQSAGCFTNSGCTNLLIPHQLDAQPCESSLDCASSLEGCGGFTCPTTCQPKGTLDVDCLGSICTGGLFCDESAGPPICRMPLPPGSLCQPYNPNNCDSSSYCDPRTALCLSRDAQGQPCRATLGVDTCVTGTFCKFISGTTFTCQPQVGTGADCTNDQCVGGDFCDFTASPLVCRVQLGQGAACSTTYNNECQSGLVCIQGTCQPPVTLGGACFNYGDCHWGLSCDSILRTCQPYTNSGDAGAACTDVEGCSIGLSCANQVLNPDGGLGTPGICKTPAVGDGCLNPTTCPKSSTCVPALNGTCQTSSLGDPCYSDWNCPSETFCGESGLGFTCQAAAGPGQSCSFLSLLSCTGGDSCYSSGDGGACQPMHQLGAACSTVDFNDGCELPYQCDAGTCVLAGEQGTSCFNLVPGAGGYCWSGECSSGTCLSTQSNGQSCTRDWDCVSGDCRGGQCAAPCP